jgi:hypothetical protein
MPDPRRVALLLPAAIAAEETADTALPMTRPRPARIPIVPPSRQHSPNDAVAQREHGASISSETREAAQQMQDRPTIDRVGPKELQALPPAHGPVAALIRESRDIRLMPATPQQTDAAHALPQSREVVEKTAPAPPSVQVTIGRIEIRAVSAPPQTAPAPRAPSMSLEDYLANRGKS